MFKIAYGIARLQPLISLHRVTSCHILSQIVTADMKHERREQRHPFQPFIIFMDTSSATAQDHLRKSIDDEIKMSEEATQELKYRRNALAPISRLPPETLLEIFSLLRFSVDDDECIPYLDWIYVTHVCHRWHEVALHSPHLWDHINFTNLTLAGVTETLARAKMLPLHLEAKMTPWNKPRFNDFGRPLEAHISHTRHLNIFGEIQAVLEQLVSPAHALEVLSLMNPFHPYIQCVIPDTLFNGTAPKLTRLETLGCNIGWKLPLFKGLQNIKIRTPSRQGMPTLEDWLAGLNEMSQLKTLILDNAIPAISVDSPLISEPQLTATLPSLTHLNLTAPAKGCALALAHLVLPALISLHLTAESQSEDGDDVRLLIPYVARNAYGPQDTAPLQTILFNGQGFFAQIVAWSVPDADVEVYDWITLEKVAASARLVLTVMPEDPWRDGTSTAIFDAIFTHLPLNAISKLSAQNHTRLSKEIWLTHVPKLTMLKRALLVPTAVRAFREMLEEDPPPNGLRLPQLTKLILSNIVLTSLRTYHLRDMLVKRKEHGAPLEALDLRTCIGSQRAIELLSETVGNVQRPAETLEVAGLSAFSNWEGRVDPFCEEERTDDEKYDDGPGPWYYTIHEDG